MSILQQLWLSHLAGRDARARYDGKDQRLATMIGPAPAEVERGSYLYREAVQGVADTGLRDELRDDVRRGEDLQALVGTPTLLTLGLIIVWVIEFAGALLLLRSLGFPAEHRILPAAALTLTLVGLTMLAAKATRTSGAELREPPVAVRVEPGGEPEEEAKINPLAALVNIEWKRYFIPAVYGVLVLAIAMIRVAGSNGEDVPTLVAWSEAAIMVAITIGPAFAATWLERKRNPAAELARKIRSIRRRLRTEEKRIAQDNKFLLRVDRDQVAWTRRNVSLRATYATAHQLTGAEAAREFEASPDNASAPEPPRRRRPS